jgi:hypothetical protein
MSGISQADAFDMLARRLEHAREKHPVFARSLADAYWVIVEEGQELDRAIFQNEGPARILDEALDVAATAMRLVMGEVQG